MKKLLTIKRKKQSGFAMIEILLMIGVLIALAAVMVYALYSKVSRQSQNVQATTDVTNIISSARDFITNNPVKCGNGRLCLSNDDAHKKQETWGPKLSTYGLSNKLEQNGRNSWGGQYELFFTPTTSTITVTMTGIPAYMTTGTDNAYIKAFNSSIGNLGDQNVDGAADDTAQGSANRTECVPDPDKKEVVCSINL